MCRYPHEKEQASNHGCIENNIWLWWWWYLINYKKKGDGKDHVNINHLSLNLDDNISKRKQIATKFYTDNDNKR